MQEFIEWHNGYIDIAEMKIAGNTQEGFVSREIARAVLDGEYF